MNGGVNASLVLELSANTANELYMHPGFSLVHGELKNKISWLQEWINNYEVQLKRQKMGSVLKK